MSDVPPSPDPAPGHRRSHAATLELAPEIRRRVRRLAWLYLLAAVILLPWIAYLALSLPRRSLDVHYRAAWVGFDLLLVVALARTAYMAFRVDARIQLTATAAATLLIVDAWFDVTTSHGRASVMEAVVLALVIEIPVALYCLFVARRVSAHVFELAHLERMQHAVGPPSDAGTLPPPGDRRPGSAEGSVDAGQDVPGQLG